MDHWHHFAYLRGDDAAAAALARLSPPLRDVHVIPAEINGVDRPILCVDIEALKDGPHDLRAELAGVDTAAFEGFLRAYPIPTWDDDEEERVFERERARVRAMVWLSREIDGPVGYWYHEGDNGMCADHFLGFGPRTAMWANQCEGQGREWDESRPRGAYTAALWHIGVPAPNLNEYDSMFRAFGWPRVAIGELSEEVMSSLACASGRSRGRITDAPWRPRQDDRLVWRRWGAGWSSWVRKLVGRGPGD
jgi:hypothetical protein